MPLRRLRPPGPEGIYEYKGIYFHTFFQSLDGFGIAKQGTASDVTLDGLEVTILAGVLTGDYAWLQKRPYMSLPIGYGSGVQMSWTKPRRFKTRIQFSALSGVKEYATVGGFGTFRHFGFETIDDKIYGSVGDGTAQSKTPALHTIVVDGINNFPKLEARFYPALRVDFYIFDEYKASLSQNLPSGAIYAEYMITTGLTLTNDQTSTMFLSEWMFLQEP